MKRSIILILVAILCYQGYAQDTRVILPAEYLRNNTTGKNNLPDKIQGIPYFDPEFKVGEVFVKGQEVYGALLRYNAFSDEIEMKANGEINALLKRDYISVRIEDYNYRIEKYKENSSLLQGYFIVLNEGKYRLLLRKIKVFQEGKEANNSYGNSVPSRFEKSESYYIADGSEVVQKVRLRKKDLLAILGNNADLLDFINSKGYKLKSATEVIEVLDFLNRKEQQ